MSGLESLAVNVGQGALSAVYEEIKTYVNYIKDCEENLRSLLNDLETLRAYKDDIDGKVLSGKENLGKVTEKTRDWLASVKRLVKNESMKMLMNKDIRIAKVMLRLIKDDLKKLVEQDGGEMRDVVVKVMKDIAKRKREAGNTSEVSDVDEKDEEVGQVLEKLMEKTMDEFKKLMRNDDKMAIAAMHLLEDNEKLEKLTEKDKEVADIIAKARRMSNDQELLSENHDDDEVNVDTLKAKITNLLKPVGNIILNEELLKTLPENVRVRIEAMGVIIGNKKGLKAELRDSDNKTRHRNCCCCVISYKFLSERHDISVAAKDMYNTIKGIIANIPGNQDVTLPKRRGEMEEIRTCSVDFESRKDLFQKIIKALASSDVHVVGLIGMGGSGKTTLANEIFNSKAEGTFETAVMVEISESPNLEFIQDQIADGLDLDLHYVHGVYEKAIRLRERLKPEVEGGKNDNNAKKILVVLDNIWKKMDLAQMGIPREYCKLLVTSREREVCKAMDVQKNNIFEVGLLENDEPENLFKFQVQMEEVTGEYKVVADRLLKKCGGLPLSIVATANSLKGKELPFWRQFAEELEKPISCQSSGVQHETFSILRTSYEFMASEEKKKFFLLACLSPVGSSISIDNLMRYGIGLDLFQHVNKLSEAIDLARTWAEELVASSMLLKADSDEYVKIHDVVRESTMSFASKSAINTDGHMFLVDAIPRWICEETFNKYTGISLLAQPNFAPLSGVKADLLQILLFKGNRDDDAFLESNFFQGMTNLKVLEMLYMNFEKGLPESLCKLKLLKTLHLVECKLGDIKLIGELGRLLVLSLRGSSLDGLPDEIGKLNKLRLLDMTNCQCKEPRVPTNVIAKLSLVEGLYLADKNLTYWVVQESTSNDTVVTNEFNKLEFLNVLEIHMRGQIYLPICDQFVNNLDKFQIIVGKEGFKLQPSQRALMVSEVDVSQELKKDNYFLKELLKKADFLALKSATVQNIVPELDKEGYRNLTRLELSNINSISRICEGEAPHQLFCKLCHLEVSNLEKLEVLLPVNPLPRKMTTLEISDCINLTYIFSEDKGGNKESDIIELPLEKLKLYRVSNLISMVKESNNDDRRRPSLFSRKVTMKSLEKLWLENNERIVKLWDKESNLSSFQNLKVLRIIGCSEMESIGPPSMFLYPVQLETLTIRNCQKMQQVISKEESERQEISEGIITFRKLNYLGIHDMENLECFYGETYKMAFPCLKELTLYSLKRMTKFEGGTSSRAFFPKTVTMKSLEILWLSNNERIVKLWDKESNLSSFQNLKVLRIIDCSEMESIGPPSIFLYLVQLETLTIVKCQKMQQVISKEESERQEEIITFRKLNYLKIQNMENLECFYGESKMEFPCLKDLTLDSLKRMTKFAGGASSTTFFPQTIEFPHLEELRLLDLSDEVRVIWDLHEGASNPIPSLRNLNIGKIKLPSIVFQSLSFLSIEPVGDAKFLLSSAENEGCLGTFSQFPKLEELRILGCSNSAQQFVKDDGPAMLNFCGQLRSLEMESASNIEMTSLHSFKSLCKLRVSGLKSEYFFSVDSGFEQLQSLEELSIKDCPNMKVIIQGGDKVKAVVFRRLERIYLKNLGCMSKLCSIPEIPLDFPSLEKLYIDSCNKLESPFCGEPNQVVELPALEHISIWDGNAMKSFSTKPLKAPKLRQLTVCNCPHMEWFLLGNSNCNAVLELPSLENVTIKKCPNMKSFSPAVLRAPILQLMKVDDKPYPISEIEDFKHVLQSANSREQTAADKNDL